MGNIEDQCNTNPGSYEAHIGLNLEIRHMANIKNVH